MHIVTAALALAAAAPAPAPDTRAGIEAERAKLEAELDALEARAKAEDWRGPSSKQGKRTVDHAFDGAARLWMLCATGSVKRRAASVPAPDAIADAAMNDCAALEADFRRASALGYREMGASDPDGRSDLVRRDARNALRQMIGTGPARSGRNR